MMKKKSFLLGILMLLCFLLGGCGTKNSKQENGAEKDVAIAEEDDVTVAADEVSNDDNMPAESVDEQEQQEEQKSGLADGIYTAEFTTDSSMFHVSEACDGKGTLTVQNGEMTIHISLMSKKIVNLYPGLAEDAERDGAVLLMPTEDTVTYSDGMTEEVYGFDVPVPALDEEFDLALIGTKGTWYDHKVSVSNPQSVESDVQTETTEAVEDGIYTIALTFEGGSGKAEVLSPATIKVAGESMTATIRWSSPNYDYMIVDGEKYLPINTESDTEEGSIFEIPVSVLDEPMEVIGDTVAMSKPHEITYTLTFHSDTMEVAE